MAEDYSDDDAAETSGSTPKTALIPIDFFEGKDLEPGATCEVRITKVHSDQAEVEYVPHSDEDAELGESDVAMPSGMEEMMG